MGTASFRLHPPNPRTYDHLPSPIKRQNKREKMSAFRASRQLFQQAPFRAAFRPQFQNASRFGSAGSKRWQSTAEGAQQQGWFKRMWESEVGFKTVHFWAPVMKWALVLAGVSDFARPAEKLSFTQNFALTCIAMHESAKKSGEQIKEDIKADVQERVEGAKETAGRQGKDPAGQALRLSPDV